MVIFLISQTVSEELHHQLKENRPLAIEEGRPSSFGGSVKQYVPLARTTCLFVKFQWGRHLQDLSGPAYTAHVLMWLEMHSLERQ